MIDAGIYNALGRGVKTVRDWQVEDEQRQQAAQANELNALNLGNARATAADNALVRGDKAKVRNVLAGYKPGDDLPSLFESTGTLEGLNQAQAMRAAQAEAAKVEAERKRAEAAAAASSVDQRTKEYKFKIDQHSQALRDVAQFQTPADALADLERKAQNGELPMDRAQIVAQRIQQARTPEEWAATKKQIRYELLDAKDQLEQEWKAAEAARNQTKDAQAAANQDILIVNGKRVINPEKQQAAVERAKASVAPGGVQPVQYFTDTNTGQVFPLPTKVGPGGPGPMKPVMGPDGKPIGGKTPGTGQPTEDERKSAGWAIRMEDALQTLANVEAEGSTATRPGFGTALTNMLPEGIANVIRPEDRQRVEAAQIDALDAALTLSTGAAYTREQLQGLSRSYFAQPNDKPKTIEEKQARLQKVIETARIRAGRAAPDIAAVNNKQPTGAPAPALPPMSAIEAELARRKVK